MTRLRSRDAVIPSWVETLYVAARGTNVEAQYRLGMAHRQGEGVPQDDCCAAYWLRKAAHNGHMEAGKQVLALYSGHDAFPADSVLTERVQADLDCVVATAGDGDAARIQAG